MRILNNPDRAWTSLHRAQIMERRGNAYFTPAGDLVLRSATLGRIAVEITLPDARIGYDVAAKSGRIAKRKEMREIPIMMIDRALYGKPDASARS